ncbi:PREDICTED: uncharacterized protein LOC106106103 [Papilio polytes]|uniref:uncharacterized protein LOC106106103 n=1 Tax=Papilio polytes TaxID=76194 RepID=UPI00067633C4|nr:PREDICTED: uncharacterized protein LOC106106103 [Papilio polytes]
MAIASKTITGLNITAEVLNKTRRILRGTEAGDSKPFMVYLRPAREADSVVDRNWLCGGVIIHENYILTSAACIENIGHFYVVSGTHRWIPPGVDDDCIKNGAMKAVWKCVPANYEYDGDQFENIRWMINDIAVVKVEDKFNFHRRVVGCEYSPKRIQFNNKSIDLEAPGTMGTLAGWGSQNTFGDPIQALERQTINSPVLMETTTMVLSKAHCKRRWPERYHYIIEKSMICAKDSVSGGDFAGLCNNKVKCKELVDSQEDYGIRRSDQQAEGDVHNAAHSDPTGHRRAKLSTGGFCENDHGGPLVVGHGNSATVIGIISACLTTNLTRKCYGPFLYTSVFNNHLMITCAVDKEVSPVCRSYVFRATNTKMIETTYSWIGHPDGPAKSELVPKYRRDTNESTENLSDKEFLN